MWPEPRVVRLVTDNFRPARVHVRDPDYQRVSQQFGAPWTPTILLLDPGGVERHRIEGFLPVEDFLAQLTLGLGHLAFAAEQWQEAEQRFEAVVRQYPRTDAAPEAQYWAGVSRYKAGNAGALADTGRRFQQQYPDSTWAKKASVWNP